MKDPLAGKRAAINDRDVTVLIWPAVDSQGHTPPCPVAKGDRFTLRSCVIEIEQPARKLPKGRKAEWHATFIRHETERPQLLRSAPPKRPPSEDDAHLGLTQTERARREGMYTASRFAALKDEPESVGPDWKDEGVGEREQRRLEAQRERQREREAQAAKSRLNRLLRNARTPKEADWLLSQIIALCEAAEAEHLDRAA